MRSLLVAVSLAALVACKPSKPPEGGGARAVKAEPAPEPTPPPQALSDVELEQLMRDVSRLMSELADGVEATGGDCGAMAAAINRVVDNHAALLERMRTLKDPAIEDRVQVWMNQHGDALNGFAVRAGTATERCAGDEAVGAAMERLSEIDVDPKEGARLAVEVSVSLYEAIARLEPGTSCADSATAIGRLIGERAAALRTLRAAARDGRRAQVDALLGQAAGRLGGALASIESLSRRCTGEPAVGAALAGLEGG